MLQTSVKAIPRPQLKPKPLRLCSPIATLGLRAAAAVQPAVPHHVVPPCTHQRHHSQQLGYGTTSKLRCCCSAAAAGSCWSCCLAWGRLLGLRQDGDAHSSAAIAPPTSNTAGAAAAARGAGPPISLLLLQALSSGVLGCSGLPGGAAAAAGADACCICNTAQYGAESAQGSVNLEHSMMQSTCTVDDAVCSWRWQQQPRLHSMWQASSGRPGLASQAVSKHHKPSCIKTHICPASKSAQASAACICHHKSPTERDSFRIREAHTCHN
jgi:hypothetical protein